MIALKLYSEGTLSQLSICRIGNHFTIDISYKDGSMSFSISNKQAAALSAYLKFELEASA